MEKENRHLSCKVDNYNKEFIGGKQKIVFEINIEFIYNKWVIRKRYSDFETLQKSLRETFSHLPSLPGKKFFALKKDSDIEKRRIGLDTYIKELVKRSDIYSDTNFINFFEVSWNLLILMGLIIGIVGGASTRHND
jgi:hypothetical protein